MYYSWAGKINQTHIGNKYLVQQQNFRKGSWGCGGSQCQWKTQMEKKKVIVTHSGNIICKSQNTALPLLVNVKVTEQ